MLRSFAIRFGLGALGAVYVALGIVSARVAMLGAARREQGIPAALRFLLAQPRGPWILGAVVVGLGSIAAVQIGEAAFGRRGAATRTGLAASGIGYAILAWSAGRLLLHLNARGTDLQKASVSWLLGQSWGPAFLEAVGVAIAAGGLWEIFLGVRGRLPFRRDLLPRHLARFLSASARFGLAARGLVVCAVGYFVVAAAEDLDATRVKTVGGTLRVLSKASFGPLFTGIVALGLAAYGVYMWTLMLLKRKV
ncbi:MAG TPA: DUF1206 domain-containing protein [Thermoanaerobaculia bacterium]|nr:DUF1206 domain-containing protein [Thermoanaerobaculia bacterium]